jgi:hypothetical protein
MERLLYRLVSLLTRVLKEIGTVMSQISAAARGWVLLALCLIEATLRTIRPSVFHSFETNVSTMPLITLTLLEISVIALVADAIVVATAKGLSGLLGRLFSKTARR